MPVNRIPSTSVEALQSSRLHHDQEPSSKRVIFDILQCVSELGLILSALKMDYLKARKSSGELLDQCTGQETNSYWGQALTSLAKATVVVLPLGEMHQKALQTLGDVPQAVIQGHLNTSSSQKNLLNKEIDEDARATSLLQQFSSSINDLTVQLIRNSGLT